LISQEQRGFYYFYYGELGISNSFPAVQGKTGPGDGFLAAEGAAGRSFKPLPLLEGEAAVAATGRENNKLATGSRGFGKVIQMA